MPGHDRVPDETFHNFKASKSGDKKKLYVVPKRRSTDFKALDLGKGRSGVSARSIFLA